MRTAKVTVPCRFAAQAAAPATSGSQPCAVAGQASAASSIATARRRIARRRYRRAMSHGPSTRAVHAGLPPAAQGEPILPGPVLAAPYHLRGDPHSTPYGYGRDANPTWTALERAIGELDGGRTVVFSSGMAAVAAVVLPRLRPGDVLVACGDGYPGIRQIAADGPASRRGSRSGWCGPTPRRSSPPPTARRSCGSRRPPTRGSTSATSTPCARRPPACWRSTTRSPRRSPSSRSTTAPTSP